MSKTDSKQFASFLRTALMPMLVLKAFILYFGLNYTMNPGEGYGWGLVITLAVSLASFVYFLYTQAQLPDEEQSGEPPQHAEGPRNKQDT